MSFVRKLELGCGVALGLLEIALPLVILNSDYNFLKSWKDILAAFLVPMLFYLVPGWLIVQGSYLHSVKQQTKGRTMLRVGCSLTLVVLFMFVFSGAARGKFPSYFAKLYLSAFVVAMAMLIISFIVERQNSKATSSS